MSRAEKSLQRLLSRPRDYTWSELTVLMESLGYVLKKGSGSSRKFIYAATRATLMLHEPHPKDILKSYMVSAVIQFLKQEKHLP